MADGQHTTGALGNERLIGELTRLQVRYPMLIHHLSRSDHSICIWYFIEDLAIECVRVLQDAGIHAEHHSDEARAVQLATSRPITGENRDTLLETLESYLKRCSAGTL